MSAAVHRVLAPNDLRLIWRDGFLLVAIFVLPAAAVAFRWLLPWLNGFVAEWVALESYYGLIYGAFIVAQQPLMIGAVIGILFVEERDQGTLLALQATPVSLRGFLGYRLLAGMVSSTALCTLAIALAGRVRPGAAALLAACAVASLGVPIVALAYAIFLDNKLQAVTAIKLVQSASMLPVLLFFAPPSWAWAGAIALPLYFPIRFFATAADGRPEWWLLGPGAALLGAAALALLRRFRRTVFV